MIEDLPECPVEVALQMIGDKWKTLILRELVRSHKKTLRYSEIKSGINSISDKMLSQKLKIMENSGLISREVFVQVPLKVEYSLTELGMTLCPILSSLTEWGTMYKKHIEKETENE